MKVSLRAMNGAMEGKELEVPRTINVIGRSKSCDIRVDEPSVSRRHCELMVIDDRIFARDLNSTHGTRVDGKRISGQRQLHAGELLAIGRCVLRIEVDHSLEGSSRQTSTARRVDVEDEATGPGGKTPAIGSADDFALGGAEATLDNSAMVTQNFDVDAAIAEELARLRRKSQTRPIPIARGAAEEPRRPKPRR